MEIKLERNQKKAFVLESLKPLRENHGEDNMPARKVTSKDPRVQAALNERRARVAARKAAKNKKTPAKPAARTKGITNIIKKRKEQAARIFKQATR